MTTEEWNMMMFMMMFMMKSAPDYDNYQEYQVIERNVSAPAPISFEPVTAESSNDDHNINITVIA